MLKKQSTSSGKMDAFMTQTSKTDRKAMDQQIAHFLDGTNTLFSVVGHPEFVKLIQLLRLQSSKQIPIF